MFSHKSNRNRQKQGGVILKLISIIGFRDKINFTFRQSRTVTVVIRRKRNLIHS